MGHQIVRIEFPGFGALAREASFRRLSRWLAGTDGRIDWRARALDAELALTIERARARLAEQHTAARLAEITAALGWLHEVVQAPPANDDPYDRSAP